MTGVIDRSGGRWLRAALTLMGLVLAPSILPGCERRPSSAVTKATAAASALPSLVTSATPLPSLASAAPATTASGLPVAEGEGNLPPVSRNKISAATIRESKQAEDAGENAYKTRDYAGSVPLFERAIQVDPGNVHARFELSRSFARLGNTQRALGLLSSLRDFGCPLCAERVLAARADDAFAPLISDPRYVELSRGLDAKLFKLKPAGQRIINWLMSSALGAFGAEELLDPRALVVIEDRSPDAKRRFIQVFGQDELRNTLSAHYPKGIYPGELDRCSAGCCTTRDQKIPAMHPTRICFTTFGENVVHLYKLEVEGDRTFSFPE